MNLAELAHDIPFMDVPPNLSRVEISGITEDSRKVERGMLFAALAGSKANGAVYINDAIARGAVAILSGFDASLEHNDVPLLRAKEPRQALALMAARFFGAQPEIAVAVTGTNGKTSVTSFLREIWISNGFKAASLGTVGIVTGDTLIPLAHTTPDPVTLHRHLADLAKLGVSHLSIEASSHGLAQYRLDGLKLAAGAFLNITRDHLDYHGSFEAYLAAKLRLFSELLAPGQPAIIDADSPGAEEALRAAQSRVLKPLLVGERGDFIRLRGTVREGFRQRLRISHGGRELDVLLPLAGHFQAANALAAAALAIATGVAADRVFEALTHLKGAKGRLEFAGATASGAPIFIDYAHTPDALVKALEALRPYATGRLAVVFGCGGDRDKGKRPQMGAAAVANADLVYVTDDNPRSEDPAQIRREIMAAAPGAREIAGRGRAVAQAVTELAAGDVLLVAGKGHETGQIVAGKTIPYSDHEAVAAALAGRVLEAFDG